jgi:hypothetical protein
MAESLEEARNELRGAKSGVESLRQHLLERLYPLLIEHAEAEEEEELEEWLSAEAGQTIIGHITQLLRLLVDVYPIVAEHSPAFKPRFAEASKRAQEAISFVETFILEDGEDEDEDEDEGAGEEQSGPIDQVMDLDAALEPEEKE